MKLTIKTNECVKYAEPAAWALLIRFESLRLSFVRKLEQSWAFFLVCKNIPNLSSDEYCQGLLKHKRSKEQNERIIACGTAPSDFSAEGKYAVIMAFHSFN